MKPTTQAEEDALRTIREIQDLISTIEKLRTETEIIDRLIHDLNQGYAPKEQDLKPLDLTPQPLTLLKLRLRGIQETKKAALFEHESKFRDKKELLEDIMRCPVCRGHGITMKRVYDRSDGRITTIAKTEICCQCGGTGRREMSDYIKDLMRLLPIN